MAGSYAGVRGHPGQSHVSISLCIACIAANPHLCFVKSSGRGPNGTLCWSRIDCRRPRNPDLFSATGGLGADVGFVLIPFRSLLSVPLVVLANLRRTRPSVEYISCCVAHTVQAPLCLGTGVLTG
jgi:hypothetical protein